MCILNSGRQPLKLSPFSYALPLRLPCSVLNAKSGRNKVELSK